VDSGGVEVIDTVDLTTMLQYRCSDVEEAGEMKRGWQDDFDKENFADWIPF
jgi:hypothetical protein